MNQRIRFKGPRREWHHASDAASAVAVAPEQAEVRENLVGDRIATAAVEARALRQVPANWQSSSYDLMSGLQITEFEDTIPDALLDHIGL